MRAERGVLIVETRSGWVCANAGIDTSNVPGEDRVTLLPEDPDASARRIRAELRAASASRPAVVIADSFGRPWRLGQTDVAIGCAGVTPLEDRRGPPDREGRELAATVIAIADQVAAAADLARAKDDGMPACVVRGLGASSPARTARRARRSAAPRPTTCFARAPDGRRHRVGLALLGVLRRPRRPSRGAADREHPRPLVAGDDLALLRGPTRAKTPGSSS